MSSSGFRSETVGRRVIVACAALAWAIPLVCAAYVQETRDCDSPVIHYSTAVSTDAVARLQQRIARGEIKLRFEPGRGYLKSVLDALGVPVSSQTLVFSKTSFQRDLISPETPRALYFSDGVYIGFVQGGRYLEAAAVDPKLGATYYIMSQEGSATPRFVRQTEECLQCHASTFTRGVPGHIMRSVYPAPDGQPVLTEGTYVTTDQSPMKERWGGWYVTGKSGSQYHMGNMVLREGTLLDLKAGSNTTDLSKLVDTAPYLSKYSDMIALMVMEHQTHIQNLITQANYQTRIALDYEAALNRDLKRGAAYRSESTVSRIASACEPLVKGLLFCDEAPLTEPVTGCSGFGGQFQRQGIKDSHGRSLRQLNLTHRLFRYPCSYLIYSEAFDALPPVAKSYVYRRLRQILSGKEAGSEFAHLTGADRAAILDILRETKPDFASAQG